MPLDPSEPPPVGPPPSIRRVRVVEHDTRWPRDAAASAAEIMAAIRPHALLAGAEIHHIGSTAVPGLPAEPILDLLLAVPGSDGLEALDRPGPRRSLGDLGFRPHGEHGVTGRRFFTRTEPASGDRTHHLHAFAADSHGVARHLAFRDYLRAHPAVATTYGVLKQSLAASCEDDVEAYLDGKHAFIREHEARALAWAGHIAEA